jgi:beta-phosphoglucomutase-like phosphatase (HAD superfamily)
MPLPKIAIFALGGLVHYPAQCYRATLAIFARYNVEPPPWETYIKEIKPKGVRGFFRDCGIADPINGETPVAIYEEYLITHRRQLELRENAKKALTFCHSNGMKTAIIGGVFSHETFYEIKRHGLARSIDHVEGFSLHGDRELNSTLACSQSEANAAIYADNEPQGLCAAKELGIWTIGMPGGFEQSEATLRKNSNRFATDFGDVIRLLKDVKAE